MATRCRVPRAQALRYAGVGAIVGIHWLCFYGAIKVAGIATAVLTLSTMAFFTAFIEPIAFRRRIDRASSRSARSSSAASRCSCRSSCTPTPLGLALGLGSALFASMFGVMNGKLARTSCPERLMLYEVGAAFVVVSRASALVPAQLVTPSQRRWISAGSPCSA